MYYTPQKRSPGKYGADSYSVPFSSVYSPSSKKTITPIIEKRGLGCCGRGCKPCVADFKM